MAKGKVSKATKHRLKFLGPILLVCILVFIISLTSNLYKLRSLQHQENVLAKELTDLERKELELSSEINKLKDQEYIAKYARENYYYTKKGEYVIKIKSDEKTEDEESTENPKIYYVLGSVVCIFVILLFILVGISKKSKTKK